jgi:predicted SAM-dependent methyltransferase
MKKNIKQSIKKKLPFDFIILAQEILRVKTTIRLRRREESRRKESLKYIKRLLNQKRMIFLEIGAGDKKGGNGWVTLDLTKRCDLYWDLNMGLPFPDNSVHKIYSSHVLEHFTFQEIQQLLHECLRTLVPGGGFSVCVPNARIYLSAYIKNENIDPDIFFVHKPAFNYSSRIDYVNYVAYMDGHHKYMFDEKNLVSILKTSGFKNVRLRELDSTIDLKVRDFESIYAIGEK